MKVQLVTHSIIPNLNFGLVPIDPVGLVYTTHIYIGAEGGSRSIYNVNSFINRGNIKSVPRMRTQNIYI